MSSKTKLGTIAALCIMAAGSASAMSGGDQVVNRQVNPQKPNQQQPTQQRVTAPANTFNIDIGGTQLAVPLSQNVCAFDEKQTFDASFIKSFQSGAGNTIKVFLVTANCAELAAARNGSTTALKSVSTYSAPTAALNTTLTTTAPKDFARDVCNRELARLNQTAKPTENPDPAADKLMRDAERQNRRAEAVLFLGEKACYTGTVSKTPDGFISAVNATTLVSGKAMLVSNISLGQNALPVKALLQKARQEALALANANPAS